MKNKKIITLFSTIATGGAIVTASVAQSCNPPPAAPITLQGLENEFFGDILSDLGVLLVNPNPSTSGPAPRVFPTFESFIDNLRIGSTVQGETRGLPPLNNNAINGIDFFVQWFFDINTISFDRNTATLAFGTPNEYTIVFNGTIVIQTQTINGLTVEYIKQDSAALATMASFTAVYGENGSRSTSNTNMFVTNLFPRET